MIVSRSRCGFAVPKAGLSLEILVGHVSQPLAEIPDVPFAVERTISAISVWLVLRLLHDSGARLPRLLAMAAHVVDAYPDELRERTNGFGTLNLSRPKQIGIRPFAHHADMRAFMGNFRVRDPTVLVGQKDGRFKPKGALKPRNRCRRVLIGD